MHPYRTLIQTELDARGWTPSELARRAGLHRQTIHKILKDTRPHLGQMPDDTTIDGIARGFGIPADRVRQAAARSLTGYVGDETDPLDAYTTEYLLEVIRRRVTPGSGHPDRTAAEDTRPRGAVLEDRRGERRRHPGTRAQPGPLLPTARPVAPDPGGYGSGPGPSQTPNANQRW